VLARYGHAALRIGLSSKAAIVSHAAALAS
jgi:hypothetical protein